MIDHRKLIPGALLIPDRRLKARPITFYRLDASRNLWVCPIFDCIKSTGHVLIFLGSSRHEGTIDSMVHVIHPQRGVIGVMSSAIDALFEESSP